ncbi:S-DNA-T family DNA segregation ATPase FtsK/SpoIIIE [Arthrobacter ginsengisoli]|uniref:S-DNA-T family DNA segregation ATPase FtsK/SpoIIIE n=1 Tax=Arthrobacter ginsengisoli TaxID=1356565 RepID=A0ABU1UD72_9MICC|nr:FtsK/SpoIIIE domain-containing protein [Arthrobacter ginsengisoli]MDR7083065.1 S-DNA-T family DNA segregation ATPase FtsK/SpoIIIE [Arthrobacter ginsengisoli]
MLLHCTLVPAPGSALTSGPVELAIEVPAACPGAELQAAISRRFGTGDLTVDRVPVAGLDVGEAPLVHGAVLVDGAVPAAPMQAAPLILVVHGGPAAGLVVPLRRGRFRIGRRGTEIVIPDAEMSREHARLDVTDSAVTLLDLGSANGVSVDGRKVHTSAVSTESLIQCGGSSMSVVFGGTLDSGIPAAAGSDVSAPLLVSNPAAPGNRAALLLTALLPFAIGVGLAILTGWWMFLAFTAVSAVSVLVPAAAGRRQRRELRSAVAAAAREDKERRRRAAPSAGELSLRGSPAGPDPLKAAASRGTVCPGPVWLRLGQAQQRANIRLEPPDPGFRPPLLGTMPVTLDPGTAVTALRGPEPAMAGLVRSVVLQLACYPAARRTRIVIHGPTPPLLAARFLAAATLSADEASTLETLAAGFGQDYERGVLLIVTAPATAALRSAAVNRGWQVLDCSGDPAPAAGAGAGSAADLVLTERTARLSSAGTSLEFSPDLVPSGVFDRNCRRLQAAGPAAVPRTGMPAARSLGELLPLSAAGIASRWAESAGARGLPVPVGVGSSGPLQLDLQADGPHLLVAGTTGSGKSEFLRTLAAALAAGHPPDRVNLLLIDFKGGSGLRPLSGLAHCVGLLTDLDINGVARTLVSLRAEVHRREELFASHRAADLRAYESVVPSGPPLPHLVVIIDEFRMLVDEAPEALTELMRIAAIGRSLGIHLVMATQRPQGAVSPDIRANVTSCVALRVQSELESFDIINSRLAAAIPITSPGRAYLVRGNEAPEEFQTATIGLAGPGMTRSPTVMRATEFLNGPVADESPGVAGGADPQYGRAVTELADAVTAVWEAACGGPLHRPVAPPLPKRLPFPRDGSRGMMRLGLVDVPEEQRVAEFGWHPGLHGHLGLVSGNTGGADAALGLIVNQLLGCSDERHLYVLDAAGSFHAASTSPRVGALVGLRELRRAARVLERVSEEMTRRLGTAGTVGLPALVLALCGWGSWVSAFRAGPLAWAEDLVQDIVRDGARAGITVLVAGERELVASRFFAAIPNRIFVPAGSTEEGRLAWPRLPLTEAVAGRVVVFGPLSAASAASAPSGHVGQLFEPCAPAARGAATRAAGIRPFRVEPLPGLVTAAEVLALASGLPALPGRLCLGVGGDELLPAGVPLPPGAVLTVLGGSASGKTSLLSALPGLNPSVSCLQAPGDPERYWTRTHEAALTGALDPAAILLVDDLDLQSPETNARLLLLNNLGWRVVLTAGFGPGIRQRVPVAQTGAGQGRGILIAPRGLMDGELFGVRFELEQSPPPGRAVVISDGRARAVQLAVDPAAGGSTGGPGP